MLCLATFFAPESHAFDFIDVDRNKLSTADGHITIVVMARTTEIDKARLVGDRVPERIFGNPLHRFVTVMQFEKSHGRAARMVANVVARRRLDAEAKRLQSRYALKKVTRTPRQDVHAVLDFDGTFAAQLGVNPKAPTFQVFVLGKKGEILQRWSGVPDAGELAAALP